MDRKEKDRKEKKREGKGGRGCLILSIEFNIFPENWSTIQYTVDCYVGARNQNQRKE